RVVISKCLPGIVCSRATRICFGRWQKAALALAAILTYFQQGTARSEYLLGPGDKLEVEVSGSFTHRGTVNADGQIAMPQIGSVTLAGLSLASAQSRLQDEYREKKILLNADVLLEVVEYRPFYISGDVARPGAYAFQPNITVRHAVALAGGLDMVRFRFGENPFVRAADLRNEYETLVIEHLRAHLRRTRLQAEIQGKSEADFGDAISLSVPPKVFEEAVELERHQLRLHDEIQKNETVSLEIAIKNAQENLDTLTAEMGTESDSAKQEKENTALAKSNFEKGIAPRNRLSEAQRDLAFASSRYLATQAQMWVARRTVDEFQRQVDRLNENRRSTLLTELQDASLALEKIQSQIKAAAEKFAVVGGARSALYTRPGNEVDVTIFRKVNAQLQTMQVTANSEVLAGDVVEIDLKPGRLLGMAAAPR